MDLKPKQLVDNSMWILALLPERLPGYVSDKKFGGQLIIRSLIAGLPLSDGTSVQRFFAHTGNANVNDYVTFCWKNPGERVYDQTQQKYRDPLAVNVQVVEEDESKQIVDDIRKIFAIELQLQLEQQQYQLQQEREILTQQAQEIAQQRTEDLRDELNHKAQDLLQKEIFINKECQRLDEQQKHIELRAAEAEKDELNLAKIENYGADLLSSLEYSRSEQVKQNLLLYSESIEIELIEEASLLYEEQARDTKQAQRLKRIQNLLKDYPSNFPIANNLVLLGTLNSDETTYDLSPKVIDRSFVITYPLADLKLEIVSEPLNPHSICKDISVSNLLAAINERIGRKPEGWETIVRWNAQYLSQLGIPLGHRAKRDYLVFNAAANCLGLTNNECLGYFITTKLDLLQKSLRKILFWGDKARNCREQQSD